jgi:hypothetical protein
MTSAAAGLSAPASSGNPSRPTLTALVVGRIAGKPRQYKDREGARWFATIVKCPAPDPYSNPSSVEVNSREPLGDVDTDVSLLVRLSGTVRTFRYQERDTGESKTGVECTHRLTAL